MKIKVIIEEGILSLGSQKIKELTDEISRLAEIIIIDPYAPKEKWIESCKDVVAIVNRKAKLSKEILNSCEKLKLIARTGVGVDETRIDLEEFKKRGITVTYNPGVNSPSVAELTFLLILLLYRKIFKINELTREGRWSDAQKIIGYELAGKVLGIIGLGNIGRRVAKIGKAFEMEVLGYDPLIPKDNIVELGAKPCDFYELLSSSDIITIHVPLTPQTYKMISNREIELMKKNAIIINTSRGGIVDEEALYEALRNKRILGAGLDVLSVEPPYPNHPLFKLENVVITPHIGGVTYEATERGFIGALTEVLNFLQGKPLKNVYKFT
jgi:D-3-phosphoglycerate dehydrogenase